ncbi:hypothetical protein DFH29DRAFT_999739 [Suillus ampliporus]|nr:hypothetical protein DFH29DRAFT_999739 [Suillus ampliporus]
MFIPKVPTEDSPDSFEFWWKMTISAFLVLAGGVFAGLTLGFMGLDELHLRVLSTSSEDKTERANAQTVLNLMQRGRHWVLVVLLLSNVVINESLPIFLDSAIGGGLLAIVISATAIVIFGVIPQAVCAKHGLAIGAQCAPFVLFMMYLFGAHAFLTARIENDLRPGTAPVAYPIAKILDYALGAHGTHTYKKAELKSFLQFHRTGKEPLRDDEIDILNGVLELSNKNVETIMTPICVSLANSLGWPVATLGFPCISQEIPLAFVGFLLIKKLLTYDPAQGLPVSHFPLSILPEALPSINCFQALDYFQTGRAHLLLISRTPGSAGGGIGLITLEDVIEEIISEEIVDETDQYEDNHSKRYAKRMINATVMRECVCLSLFVTRA